jgi:hypothetical protein
VTVICEECKLEINFPVDASEPVSTVGELRDAMRRTLGPSGATICPRCNSLVVVYLGDRPVGDPDSVRRAELAHGIGRKARGIRFAVGAPDGPRSAVWRLWVNQRGDDVYIAARGLARDIKVSLHPDYWYYGFTADHVRRGSRLLAPGEDRKKSVWARPTEFSPGWTRAFEIIIPSSEVIDERTPYEGSEAVWFPKPPEGEAARFTVLFSKKDAPRGARGFPAAEGYEDRTEFVTRLDLKTGESVWTLAHVAPLAPEERGQLEKARHAANEAIREALADARQPRMVGFGDAIDGVRFFYDISLRPLIAA